MIVLPFFTIPYDTLHKEQALFLCEMGMLNDPLLHLDAQPEAIDAKGDNGQQEPLDVIAEQLAAGAVEHQSAAIDHRMLCHPAFLHAHRPGNTNTKGDAHKNGLKDADTH